MKKTIKTLYSKYSNLNKWSNTNLQANKYKLFQLSVEAHSVRNLQTTGKCDDLCLSFYTISSWKLFNVFYRYDEYKKYRFDLNILV